MVGPRSEAGCCCHRSGHGLLPCWAAAETASSGRRALMGPIAGTDSQQDVACDTLEATGGMPTWRPLLRRRLRNRRGCRLRVEGPGQFHQGVGVVQGPPGQLLEPG